MGLGSFVVISIVCASLSYGTSPPVEMPPSPECKEGNTLCGLYTCYSGTTHVCLKYSDGSGGIACLVGESFCGGKCLAPGSGKVCVKRDDYGGSPDENICNAGEHVCGLGYCYSPSTHDCIDGNYICEKGQQYCGRWCYTASESVRCTTGPSGWSFLCKPGESVCGSDGCYNSSISDCNEAEHLIVSRPL